MKKLYIYIALVLGAILSVGCQKDIDVLTATIEDYNANNGKVYIHDRYACWHDGDDVNVNGLSRNINIIKSTSENYNGGTASIDVNGIVSPYISAYPGNNAFIDVVNNEIKIDLDSIQTYRVKSIPNGGDMQVVDGAMVGYCGKNDDKLRFLNAGALMAVVIPPMPNKIINVNSIELIALTEGAYLSGEAIVHPNIDPSMIVSSGEKNNKVMMVIPEVIQTSDGGEIVTDYGKVSTNSVTYYVAVPTIESSFEVRVKYMVDNKAYMYISNPSVSNKLVRNKIYKMNIDFSNGTNTEILFEGLGDKNSPYQIKTAEDLQLLQSKCENGNSFDGKYFIQMNNIVAKANFGGIGSSNVKFQGEYNGNDKSITSSHMGIFNVLGDGSKVHNLNVVYNSISNLDNISGGIVREIIGNKVKLYNCNISGNISLNEDIGANGVIGGICGKINGSQNIILNCNNSMTMEVRWAGMKVGGICGSHVGTLDTIEQCYNYGNMVFYSDGVGGGLLGESAQSILINQCLNNGNGERGNQTSANVTFGGILGIGSACIVNSVNNSNISKAALAGGIVGCGETIEISNCYTDGSMFLKNGGGLVGSVSTKLEVKNSYVASSYRTTKTGSFSWVVNDITSNPTIICANVFYPVESTNAKPAVGSNQTYGGCSAITIKATNDPGYMGSLPSEGETAVSTTLNGAVSINNSNSSNTQWSKWYWDGQARLFCFPH